MTPLPAWLHDILHAAPSPRAAAGHLLFHGTVEPFEGAPRPSSLDSVLWTAEDPCVAQSYCPEAGLTALWSQTLDYELDRPFLPNGDIGRAIFRQMGLDEAAMDIERDRWDRIQSYRVLPDHPTNRQAAAYLAGLGYDLKDRACWLKMTSRQGVTTVLPATSKMPGRLFIFERPANLTVYERASAVAGGLSGRQWTAHDLFAKVSRSGKWDAIHIDDIHQSKKLGHFGHASYGLFGPALARLRYHVLDVVHFDPWDCWQHQDQSTTPEFDALWATARSLPLAA